VLDFRDKTNCTFREADMNYLSGRATILWIFLGMLLTGFATMAQTGSPGASKAPPADVRPVTDDYFGTKITDPYRWMEAGPTDPKFLDFLKEQNDYTRAVLQPLASPRDKLLARIRQLDNAVPEVAAPTVAGDYIFFLQTNPGARSASLMVRDAKGSVRTLLDPETFAGKDAHANIDYFAPDFGGTLVAAGVSLGGSEISTIRVIETKTGRLLPDAISRAQYASPGWREDGKSFYYARMQQLPPDAPPTAVYENQKTFLHILGTDPDKDPAIFGPGVSPDANIPVAGFTGIATTPNCPFVVAFYTAGTTNPPTVYLARSDQATNSNTPWRKIVSADDGVATSGNSPTTIHGSTLYFLVQRGAPNRKLVAMDLTHPDFANARVILPESDAVLDGVYAAADALYILKRVGVGFELDRLAYDSSAAPRQISLPYEGAILGVDANVLTPGVRFILGSWTKPQNAFAYDPQKNISLDMGIMPRNPADFSGVEAREVMIPSTDGASVPLSIICQKNIKLDGSHPTLYEGYGSYGVSWDPYFDAVSLAWIERGGAIAVVHARGGGEFGEKWHQAGLKKMKQHTIDDMIAAAHYLIDHGYSSPAHLSVRGTSAGGISVGGAITQHPELFAAAIDNVGLTDALHFQSTQGGAANVPELGDVTAKEDYPSLFAISAYYHIAKGTKYPAVMGITGVNDPRVPSWMVAKFITALQAASSSDRPILLRVDFDAGHGIGSSRTQREERQADEWTFMLWQSGDPDFQPPKI
jgi:prolyl oligopeptidase